MLIPAHEDHSFDDWWFGAAWFYDLAQIWCHTGAYFIFGWDLQIFIELHTHPHLRDAHRDEDVFVILSWSPSWASLGSFSQAHTFWYLDILMLLLLRDAFWYVDSFRLWIWMTRITHLMMDNLRLSDFSIYHTFDVILGHISFSVEICISSWSHMILITHKTHVELIDYCYLIMIPQWSLS